MTTRIPFGLREGRMVEVSEVPRGLACGAICAVCKSPLIARQGEVREHHFAHKTGAECATALETALHLMAKQVLAETKQLALPALVVEGQATAPDLEIVSVQYVHLKDRVVTFDEVVLEPREGSIIPDARCTLGGRVCYVEIWVTHSSTDAKRAELERRDVAAVEVRLRADRGLNSVDQVRKALSGTVEDRVWLWHPKVKEAREEARRQAEEKGARAWARRRLALQARSSGGVQQRPFRKRAVVAIRPKQAAPKKVFPTLILLCESCREQSEWPNDLAAGYRPPCPTCGHPIGRDEGTVG